MLRFCLPKSTASVTYVTATEQKDDKVRPDEVVLPASVLEVLGLRSMLLLSPYHLIIIPSLTVALVLVGLLAPAPPLPAERVGDTSTLTSAREGAGAASWKKKNKTN